jgi:hypothetical protein
LNPEQIMRLPLVSFVLVLVAASDTRAQTVIQGPVVNPTTKSRYYVLQGGTRPQHAARAAEMGGVLATINNAEENAWIQANLTGNGSRKLFIGLSDAAVEGTFVWDDGSTSTYRNWFGGRPPRNSESSDAVYLAGNSAGQWFLDESDFTQQSVVEVSGFVRVPAEISDLGFAINVAAASGAPGVQLDAGTTTLPDTIFLPASGSPVVVRGAGVNATEVIGPALGPGFAMSGSWTFENLTFRRQNEASIFGTASLGYSRIQFRECRFEGGPMQGPIIAAPDETILRIERCEFRGAGLAISAAFDRGEVRVSNSVFRTSKIAEVLGGLVSMSNITSINGGVDLFAVSWGALRVSNSVIRDAAGRLLQDPSGLARFTRCVVPSAVPGEQNLVGSPMLSSALMPMVGSPCIDAGDGSVYEGALVDFVGGTRLRGAGVDIGAYETDSSAACSVDFNLDGFVDFFDYDEFVAAFELGC